MLAISASRRVLPSCLVVVFRVSVSAATVVVFVVSMVFMVFPLSGRCALCVIMLAGLLVPVCIVIPSGSRFREHVSDLTVYPKAVYGQHRISSGLFGRARERGKI